MNSEDKCKLILLVFRNKKINIFNAQQDILNSFSQRGYYFDKVEYVCFDDAEEISRALRNALDNYQNILINCPFVMNETFKQYFSKNLGQFDELNKLKSGERDIFILNYDHTNRLLVSDICTVLIAKYGMPKQRGVIRAVGIKHSDLISGIDEAKNISNDFDFNVINNFGDCKIEIIYPASCPKVEYDNVIRLLCKRFNDYIYALDDTSIAQRLFAALKLRRMRISLAESFTGGGIAKRLVKVSGISEVYFEGINAYSNESKMMRLLVNEQTLKQYGAVSEQTAREMVAGLLSTSTCDLAISTTGIAGPKSDNTSKPVGLCYIAVGTRDNIIVHKYNLCGSRENISETAINYALFHAFDFIK